MTLSLSDWFGIATLLLLLLSFIQRQRLVNKDDLAALKEDLIGLKESADQTLKEARTTNGRITVLETWKEYHEESNSKEFESLRALLTVTTDVPKPKPPRRRK